MAEQRLGGAYFELQGRSNVNQVLNQANSGFAQLEQIVSTNWWGVQNLGMAFAALPTAIAAGTGVAIQYAREWEDAMFDVGRTSGETGAALDEIEASLFRVARTSPLATAELASMAAEGAALGIANENLAEFSRVMGIMISATDLTAEGMENVARVLNIMQVPVSEYEAFASALIEVGRSTAATESDIITAAKRLATVASIANVPTQSVLAMGAALRSLGPEAEAGATAVNKTVSDMASAINEGGDRLEAFASVAGMSAEQFGQAFQKDAYVPLTAFVTGLGQLEGDTLGIEAAFEAVGIKATRTKQALSTLANGTRDVGNKQRDLNAMMDLTAKAMSENIILADIERRKLDTLSGQLQLMRNAVFEAGNAFGQMLLPAVKQAVSVLGFFAGALSNILAGFKVLHPSMRGFLSVVNLLAFGFISLMAAVLLIGPRIVIAVGALRQLTFAAATARQSGTALAASQGQIGVAIGQVGNQSQKTAINIGQLNAQMLASAQAAGIEVSAYNGATQAATRKAGAIQRLRAAYAGLNVGVRRAIVGTAAMTAGMMAMTYWAHRQGQAIQQAEKARAQSITNMRNQISEIVALGQESGKGAKQIQNDAIGFIRTQKHYRDMGRAARNLGYDMKVLEGIITGSTSKGKSLSIIGDLSKQAGNGNKNAKVLFNTLKELYGAYGEVRNASVRSASALDDYSESAKDASAATQELATSLESQAQAHIDYIGAAFAVREAQLSLKDAEQGLIDARNKAGRRNEEIKAAELDIRKARLSHQRALSDLRKAELDLSRARQDGINDLRDAEDSLADSRDSYWDGLDKIRDLEEDLDKLRSGPTVEELTKATNDLRNAQIRLLDANRKVSDAEWYLQYIREQGGSQRDIADAEFALMEARQDVANEQESLSDAEKELRDLRDTAARQQEIIKLERDLAAARRDSSATLRDIRANEQKVADIRKKVANDTFYKDAQTALIEAQIGVKDAAIGIRDAELALQKIQKGSLSLDLARAQLEYEQALYRVADANTQAQRIQAAMNGDIWTASDYAYALAGNLAAVASSVPDAAARQRLLDFANILRDAPIVPTVPKASDYEAQMQEFADDMGVSMDDALGDAFGEIDPFGDNMGSESWWKSWLPFIAAAAIPALASLFAKGGLLAGAIPFIVGAFPYLLVAAIIAGIIWWFSDPENRENFMRGLGVIKDWLTDFGDTVNEHVREVFSTAWNWLFEVGRDIVSGLWEGIKNRWEQFKKTIKDLWDRLIDNIKGWLGISSPSTVFSGIGRDMIQGLINGVSGMLGSVWNIIRGIPSGILSIVRDAAGWLRNTGHNIIIGFLNGMGGVLGQVWSFINGIPSGMWNLVRDAGTWLKNTGKNIVQGLYNGLVDGWNKMWDWARKAGSGFVGFMGKVFGIGSPSKIFRQYGEWIVEGLVLGLEHNERMVDSAAKQIAEAADIQKHLKNNDLEYLLSSDGLGPLDPAMGSTRSGTAAAGVVNNYGDNVTINAETDAEPEEIVREYLWSKRVRTRG